MIESESSSHYDRDQNRSDLTTRSTGPGKDKSRIAQTLARGLMVLNCFKDEPGKELGVKDLVQFLSLPQTVVSRIVATLSAFGYLYQNPATRKYRLGLAAFTLGSISNPYLELNEAARPWMERLALDTGESVSLTVVDRVSGDGLCIASLDTPNQIKLTTVIGSIRPLHRGATRKVLLAHLPEGAQRDYFYRLNVDQSEESHLREELAAIVKQGYAYSAEELDKGAFAIAAPILSPNGVLLGGLAVLGPLFRHQPAEITGWIASVRQAATGIAQHIRT